MSEIVYRIREVDGFDDEIAELIHALNNEAFPLATLKSKDLEIGHWWLAKTDETVAAWAGMIPAVYPNSGYFKRVGVAPEHRGRGLQRRLMRCVERRARKNLWATLYSDTTENIHSDNNFIRAGWERFEPNYRWAFKHSIYWRKQLV